MDIYTLLEQMKKRPLMYISEKRVDYIYYYLFGFCYAHSFIEEESINTEFNRWFRKWLEQWMSENGIKEVTRTVFWYEYIKVITSSEKNELEVFFNLVTLFFDDYKHNKGCFEKEFSL